MTRIAFLGLGGVGGYCGARMARAYQQAKDVEIVFLAREKTASAIREKGIKLITPGEILVAHPAELATPGSEIAPVDFLVCAVKSYDLESSLQQFSACITANTTILPLLNGIDGEDIIRRLFPQCTVLTGCIYIVSRITEPGVITTSGNISKIHFGAEDGDRDQLNFLFGLLAHTLDVTLHDPSKIRSVVWEKFIFISTIASLTSYLDVCIGKILEHEYNRRLLEELLNEICAVARAEKVLLPEDIISSTLGKLGKLPYETTSSMHSDFQKRGKTEYISLTAHVVKLAENHRIPVPGYRAVLSALEARAGFTVR